MERERGRENGSFPVEESSENREVVRERSDVKSPCSPTSEAKEGYREWNGKGVGKTPNNINVYGAQRKFFRHGERKALKTERLSKSESDVKFPCSPTRDYFLFNFALLILHF
jgi:hypothetical protein